MNLKEIKEVLQLMTENGLCEFEMEKDGLKIRLKKGNTSSGEPVIIQEYRSTAAQVSQAAKASEVSQAADAAKIVSLAKNTIKSPMVGTFYAAPAVDAQPFVSPGTQVEIGQVVCIIEAMKLMNEIKSEVRGKIVEVLVNNGDPLEFGQPLFRIE